MFFDFFMNNWKNVFNWSDKGVFLSAIHIFQDQNTEFQTPTFPARKRPHIIFLKISIFIIQFVLFNLSGTSAIRRCFSAMSD